MATETIWQHADYLHWPARADHLEEIETIFTRPPVCHAHCG